MIESEDKALFSKLKIYTLLDLALIIPSGYDDTTLSKKIELDSVITARAVVLKLKNVNGKLQIVFNLIDFKTNISATFFKVMPYHYATFAPNTKHFLQGKVGQYNGFWQLTQPKKITTPNQIVPKYKTILKTTELKDLIKKYVTIENLISSGLDEKISKAIYTLHFPNTLSDIFEDKSYKSDIIYALKYTEALNHLKKLKGKRVDYPPKVELNGRIDKFLEQLPFRLTNEQLKCIEDIKIDFASSTKATKRMVVGDVGSGKTMVILSSAMMALPHRSVLMAPTSLLALQLYEEASKYLSSFMKIALVTQKTNHNDYKEAHLIIGTHALLYKEDLGEVGLVMIDEQHRFGTAQRQRLECGFVENKKKPHMLQFSATPIPRTQAMMNSALIDVSLITTTPFTKDIATKVISKSNFADLLCRIRDEIEQNHQVLIVYPLVNESEQIPYQSLDVARGFWEKNFDNVFVTHGKDKDKEKVLMEFREEGDILLATTVVEVGISLPRLTMVVIVGAERLGLATLHQLRGRVGRNGLKSYCYLYTNSSEPNKRLDIFTKTMSGFDVAKLDLQFRNSGDILDGTIQSGIKFRWLDMGNDEDIIIKAKECL
jgi:ATP-dependent DNA helicase RecG